MMAPIYWLDFFAVIFASGALIEVWNKGSIFANLRARVGALRDVTPPETAKGLVLELLDCPFCQSYHVPVYFLLVLLAADQIGGILPALVRVFVYGWAATRLGNLLNDFLPNRMRYKPDFFHGE